jgi:hypothetical protein
VYFDEAIQDLVAGRHVALDKDPRRFSSKAFQDFAEFGVPFEVRSDDVRNWLNRFVGDDSLNAVYLDTTTLHTVQSLVLRREAQLLTPATLLDLSSFVNAVVLYDHVFHLENKQTDSFELNEALGNEPVTISLPIFSLDTFLAARGAFQPQTSIGTQVGAQPDGDPSLVAFREVLERLWYQTEFHLSTLEIGDNPDDRSHEDYREITNAWKVLFLGMDQDGSWVSRAGDWKAREYSSLPLQLLPRLVEAETMVGKEQLEMFDAIKGQRSGSPPYDLISECSLRGLFNIMVSNFLGLRYMPNSFRLPFQRFLYLRAQSVTVHLQSIRPIQDAYQKVANTYFTPQDANLVLPFFLAAVLAQISSLDEFFEVLSAVRSKATTFRQHRGELDSALQSGDAIAAKKLYDAIVIDGHQLTKSFSYAPVAGAAAAILPLLGSNTGILILTAIAGLTAFSQFSAESVERLKNRVLRPQFWFLSELSSVAARLTSAYPKIAELWGKRQNSKSAAEFALKFERLSKLQY